ncbi:MAG: hypothetical protein M3P45_10385 [Acidobacteriota bacterium]|nr:hypothetical protein [Acidobacteriota bacterium]
MKLAKAQLAKITPGNLRLKQKYLDFLNQLIKQNHLNITVDDLMSQISAAAADATNYICDGPSSTVPLTPKSFPNYQGKTVGDTFKNNSGQQALSQQDGSAIYIRLTYWNGTLLHEILNKQAVGGGFSHDKMGNALAPVVKGSLSVGMFHNKESDLLGQICF